MVTRNRTKTRQPSMDRIPRPEYPRPQFVRSDWLCLNGEWEFEIDQGDSGISRGLRDRRLASKIVVPFCPESALSGIGNEDFLNAVWYRRKVKIPAAWRGREVLLHFQAVDYDATVWVNGIEGTRHRGGFTPFSVDLSAIPGAGPGDTITIVVRARDNHVTPQPRGKQSQRHERHGCLYTRTTGIWQTVWLEPVPSSAFRRPRITPDVAGSKFRVTLPLTRGKAGQRVTARVRDERGVVVESCVTLGLDFSPQLDLPIPADRVRWWQPGDAFLYDLEFELHDNAGRLLDRATSYAGLRSVAIDGMAVTINGKRVFQRLVLDQGYYPDGIMTAPSDDALRRDIELSMEAGFNGARLHQKLFEERFLYHADRLGYLVWGEFADWGVAVPGDNNDHQQPPASIITQWLETLERDYSHPSIIGWCPLNETWQNISDRVSVLDDVTRGLFLACKAMDPTRPVLDTSGYSHRVAETDIYDSHDYDQVPETFRERHAPLAQGKPSLNAWNNMTFSLPYRGQPYFVSEFGGIWWNPNVKPGEASWGYGNRPKTINEFYKRFKGLCDVLLDDPNMFGYCYTQLTDVYQEQNGIFFFDRGVKFDSAKLRKIQTRRAAIER